MSFVYLPLDILKIIINKCDILSILRLERSCKRIKNLFDERYWKRKDKKNAPHLINISSDIKSRCIMNGIINIKVKLINKYKDIIDKDIKCKGLRSNKTRRRVKYLYLYKNYPNDELFKDLRILYNNLSIKRKQFPIEIPRYIIYKNDMSKNIDITKEYAHIKSNTIIIEYFRKEIDPDLLYIKKDNNYWKYVKKEHIEEYFHIIKERYFLTKQELQETYNLPLSISSKFDYI